MHRVDELVAEIAQERYGTFSDRDALACGASRMFIKRRIASKDWLRLAPGALGFPSWPSSWERHMWTGLHAGHPSGQVGGWAAGATYGFKGFPKTRFELLVPHGTTHENPIAVVRQTRHMPKTLRFNGFPIAERERVLCDLARQVDPKRLGVALDDQLAKGLVSLPRVDRIFMSLATPAWPGLRVMAQVIAERGRGYVPPRSDLERELRAIIASISGIDASFERRVGDQIELPQQVDCVIVRPRKLIVEADGRTYHQRVKEMALDRRRDRRAAKLGYTTFRYLYGEIIDGRDIVRAEIMAFLFDEQRLSNGG